VTLEHTSNKDGTFEGKLNAGIGNMSWKGTLTQEGLTSLRVTGAMIGSSLDMDLSSSDKSTVISGPLVIKSGDETVISADVSLKATRDQFMLVLDVASPEDPKIRSRGKIDITAKRESWNGTIMIPKEYKKFQEFTDAI
jgi:hypothetical protein